MATRRTTMRSRSGTKLYAVRDESGQFKDIQTYKRAHAADLRHKSKAEKESAQGPMERTVRKAATDAVKSVRSSMRGAVAAVERAAKRAVKQVAGPQPARKATGQGATAKAAGNPAAKKTARKVATKKTAPKPMAKKTVKKAAKRREDEVAPESARTVWLDTRTTSGTCSWSPAARATTTPSFVTCCDRLDRRAPRRSTP